MPSNDSSPDEKCTCGCTRVAHMGKPRGCLVHGFHEFAPKGSASSSPDDFCGWCKHHRRYHEPELCTVCSAFTTDNHHALVPAAGETAGEPECLCSSGSPENYEGPARDCPTHGEPEAPDLCEIPHETIEDEDACYAAHLAAEPEAPETYTAGWAERPDLGCARPDGCTDKLKRRCGSGLDGCAFAAQLRGERLVPRAGAAPPRPPYAVAYATGSGVLNEIALPGDATAAVADGALVISHPSGVLGIQHVKPYELEQS